MKDSKGINTFLIVDDSGTARMIIRQCIEIAGYRDSTFIEAHNGAEAWQILQNQAVDLMITDLNMPELDGRTLLKRIKTTPALSSPSVIVMTSTNNPAKEAELKDLGAAAVLAKPVSPASVYQTLATLNRNERESRK